MSLCGCLISGCLNVSPLLSVQMLFKPPSQQGCKYICLQSETENDIEKNNNKEQTNKKKRTLSVLTSGVLLSYHFPHLPLVTD